MRAGVGAQGVEVLPLANHILLVVVQQVGQSRQNLLRGQWPAAAGPDTASLIDEKVGVAAFGKTGTERSLETLGIG